MGIWICKGQNSNEIVTTPFPDNYIFYQRRNLSIAIVYLYRKYIDSCSNIFKRLLELFMVINGKVEPFTIELKHSFIIIIVVIP
jgi:hypothetical protein